jgi:nucleotide-binding universal stress UspA family protein
VASFIGHAFPEEMSVTLVEAGPDETPAEIVEQCSDRLGERRIERVHANGAMVDAVEAQLRLGFDLVVDAVSPEVEWPNADGLTRVVLGQHEVPVLLLRPTPGQTANSLTSSGYRRVLLPVSATKPSRAAAELAISFAASSGAIVKLLHVNPTEAPSSVQRILRTTFRSHERSVGSYADPVGQQLLSGVVRVAAEAGVRCDRIFSDHHSRAEAILEAADEHFCDLVILGVEGQEVAGEAFLGQTARRVLQRSPIAVGVIVLPPR